MIFFAFSQGKPRQQNNKSSPGFVAFADFCGVMLRNVADLRLVVSCGVGKEHQTGAVDINSPRRVDRNKMQRNNWEAMTSECLLPFVKKCLFILGGGRGRERGTQNPKQAPCCQRRAPHEARAHESEIMT